MIKYNPKAWFNLIFHSYSRHVLKTLTPVLVFMGLFTTAICFGLLSYLHASPAQFQGTSVVHSLLGIVLGLFLVFRTNSAYDRWWEGRKLWGGMVNSTRNLALKINAYLPKHYMNERTFFSVMIANFIYATKEHLRRGVQFTELEEHEMLVMDDVKKVKHRPNKFAALMYEKINELYRKNDFTGDQLINLDKEMKDLTDLMGACERIRNTPIPYSYSMFIKKFIFIYLITLPFGFIATFGYFTIPTVLLVSFVLLSVELIAEEIEDPFGRDVNDLPTDELAGRIKDNVREILIP